MSKHKPKTQHPQAQDAPLTIEQTLADREATHGAFEDVAAYAQLMKEILRNSSGYRRMSDAQREACETWLMKTARIMAGDVDHIDHAHDIAGYATLYVRACGARHAERAAAEALADMEAAMAAPRYGAGDVVVTLVGGSNE
jgi:hypothetical protein